MNIWHNYLLLHCGIISFASNTLVALFEGSLAGGALATGATLIAPSDHTATCSLLPVRIFDCEMPEYFEVLDNPGVLEVLKFLISFDSIYRPVFAS